MLTNTKHKVVVGMTVYFLKGESHRLHIFDQGSHVSTHRVGIVGLDLVLRNEANDGHVGAAHGLDFVDSPEAVLLEQLVKVGNDLVEQSEALEALVRAIHLRVELVEVGHAGEYDAHFGVTLMVEFLVGGRVQISEISHIQVQ